jgi:hypothetical protein
MYFDDTLVACPSCSCHARSEAASCPHCGAALRREDGTTPRTAGAILLGLIVATTGCSGSVEVGSSDGSTGAGAGGESATSTTSGTGTTTTTTKPPLGCGGGFSATDYGVPPTRCTTSSTGTGGAGGSGH